MTLDELRKLSPEQAMQAAAKDLSLPDNFFERQWAQESSRGQNMVSPAGARGHFGIMPATQRAWEQRDGASYNPDDFYEGLHMAQATMRENLTKFKDPVDATRAYNSGWKPERWDNPETNGYVAALWGPEVAAHKGPRLPSLKENRPAAAPSVYEATRAAAMGAIPVTGDEGIEATRAGAAVRQDEAAKEEARKAGTGFGNVVTEALRDPRVMPTWSLLSKFTDAEKPDPAFDYMAQRDKLEAGMNEEEREYLRENAVSDASATRALAEVEYRRGLNSTYSDAGAFNAFTGQMTAGLADPAGMAAGVLSGMTFQVGRIASPAYRVAAMAAENAAANVAIEGMADAVGEVKSSGDYVGAAAVGAAFTIPFARGVHRMAADQEALRLAQGMREAAAAEKVAAVTKVMQDEPHLTPEQVARRVEENETDTIRRATEDATGPQRLDRVVPEDVGREMENEFTGVVPDTDATTTPKDTTADTPDTPPRVDEDVIAQIRDKQVVDRGGIDVATGQEVRLSWSAEGNKNRPHGNVADALAAVMAHPKAGGAEKALAKYLQSVVAKDGLSVEVIVTGRAARSMMDPSGPQVRIHAGSESMNTKLEALPKSGLGEWRGVVEGSTVADRITNLSKHGLEVILHETMHAATYHRLNAWEKAAGKLTRDQQKLMTQFEDLYERFKAVVGEKHPRTAPSSYKNKDGARYAASNLHEFAAQFFTDAETRRILDAMPAKALSGRTTSALREMLSLVKRILGFAKTSAFDEGARLLDQIIAMPLKNVKHADGSPVFSALPKVTEMPAFKRWFGKSKMVGPDGEPLVMYHGTKEDFTKFEADKNGLIFVSPDPKFTTQFSGNGTGAKTMPLYVKAEKPFDPSSASDRSDLIGRLFDMHPQYTMGDGRQALTIDGRNTLYSEDVLVETLRNPDSNWVFIEQKSILDTIEHLGYDAVFVVEDGVKNLAVFEPQQLKSATGNNGAFSPDSADILQAPPTAGANGFTPMATRRSRDTWAERMVQHATNYVRQNPIDLARLKTLTQKIGGVSDGLVLAGSKNPVMQLVASLVTETTTGAAGRKANVAIRSHMLTRKFVGNTMIDYDSAYTVWRSRNGGSVVEDMFKGDTRRKFDQTVYEEVLRRRSADYAPSPDRAVIEAADALEGLFDRSRLAQVDGGVLGHAALPTSSRGYIPQSLDGGKLQAASVQDIALLHNALAEQFQARLGWDAQFARDFAPFYTERVRRRAMGDKGLDALGSGGEGLQLVRDTLDEMGADPSMVDRARAAESKMGQSHTKKRLDLDLLQELRPGLRMADFYNTNPLLMARSYAKRTAGTVALTEAGIHGIRGVRELEQAALWKGMPVDQQPNAAELEAYRRVMAEILGTPVATAQVSSGASNLALLVGLQRLGGLVFTQAAETFNMIGHLGFRSMLSGIADLPRMMGEVGRLKRGAPSGNHILTSIEQYGGEIGTETFKMIAPLDAPDHALGAYVDQPGVMTRLLRAGGHLQSKISGFRGLLAAQHRMVAEQIVMRAARFIRDGADDLALRDMGFTPEVAAAVRADLPHIARWDANDKMVEFDLTRVSDARTAEAFVQAVHRGTSQIIQGTFVGERSKWFHNDYARLLLQLRTFGLTATEKQWGRTRMNHGYTYAAGMLLGHMALTVPIHLARVQLASAGREDRDQYIKDSLKPASMVRSLLNYSSLSGLTADVSDILVGVAGGWGGSQVREALGTRNGVNAASVGRSVPIAGSLDSIGRVATGRADLHTALKQLPFSNLFYLVPAINLTKD